MSSKSTQNRRFLENRDSLSKVRRFQGSGRLMHMLPVSMKVELIQQRSSLMISSKYSIRFLRKHSSLILLLIVTASYPHSARLACEDEAILFPSFQRYHSNPELDTVNHPHLKMCGIHLSGVSNKNNKNTVRNEKNMRIYIYPLLPTKIVLISLYRPFNEIGQVLAICDKC
jgi:hypothetical protein